MRDQRWSEWVGLVGFLITCAASGCVAPTEDLVAPTVALEAPEVLDLGWIARGEPARGTFTVENVGTVAVVLEGARPLEAVAADVQLEVQNEAVVLYPGELADVAVQMIVGPEKDGEVVIPLRVQAEDFPPSDPRLPVVEVIAKISPSGLVAEPNPLTIGPVLYLDTQEGTVTIRNLRSSTVDVFAYRYAEGRVQYDEAVTRGAFGPLPTVDARGHLATLEPNGAVDVTIAYTAPEGEGEAKEQALWRVGSCQDPAECALSLVVQGLPDHEAQKMRITPAGVHFGPTPVSAEVERELRLWNDGKRPLTVSNFSFSGGSEFVAVLPSDTSVPPGEWLVVRFFYTPVDENPDNARLTFESNDPVRPMAEVRVTGTGVILPPCDLEARPPMLDYGVVDVLDTAALETVVRSVGRDRCVVFDPKIELTGDTEPNTFFFDDEQNLGSVTLDPGQETSYEVNFSPLRSGAHTGVLRLRISADDSIEIPLRGRTPGDDQLVCTPPRNIEIGATSQLVAALSTGATAVSYRWRLLNGPMTNGQIAASFIPNANTGPGVELLPEELGVYQVQLDVETDMGQTLTCQTRVTAVSAGFRAKLTWDGPGDLDLHLHRGVTTPWFAEDDCHFDNMSPVWDPGTVAGFGANPGLDTDDTSGEGPENIRIGRPRIGVPYTLAVGHFERARGRVARVEVYCGRANTQLDVTSRAFQGLETGACTRNDFWTIATVTFTAPAQCTVRMIDTYRSTNQACTAF